MTFNKMLSNIERKSIRCYSVKPASDIKLVGLSTIGGAQSLQTIEKSCNVYAVINPNNNISS